MAMIENDMQYEATLERIDELLEIVDRAGRAQTAQK